MNSKPIAVIGAGLSGSLMAILLGKMDYHVTVYEKRADMRTETVDAGRSINLALSHRGLLALEKVGLKKKVEPLLIPMKGRDIHNKEGGISFQPYGKDDTEVINSISRADLNVLLLNEADKFENVSLVFNTSCLSYDNRTDELILESKGSKIVLTDHIIIAADGAYSAVRTSMLKMGRFNYSQEFLNYGYKELEIPPAEDGGFRINKNALHIWPRGTFVMIALANPDASFTVTLFAPFKGDIGINNLVSDQEILDYFSEHFPDAVPHMPNLVEDFKNNPTGNLVTIKCQPWTKGNAVLIGDAAHAIIPFYGQGMNAAFEDCRVLAELIEKNSKSSEINWSELFKSFSEIRKPDADAIAALSFDNFIEMRDKVADNEFLRRKEIEVQMYDKYDDIISKYSMVAFHPELGYAEAKQKGEILENTISEFISETDDISDDDLAHIRSMVIQRYKEI